MAVVGDGLAAFDAAVVLKPDVVVLDVSMPILCGFDVASRLVACGRAPRIIFLTVHEDVEYLDAARRVGAYGYVLKRHIGTDLIPAIGAVLEGRQAFPPHPAAPHSRSWRTPWNTTDRPDQRAFSVPPFQNAGPTLMCSRQRCVCGSPSGIRPGIGLI